MKSEAEEKQILRKRWNDIQLVSSEVEMQAGRELAEARRKLATLYYLARSPSYICMVPFRFVYTPFTWTCEGGVNLDRTLVNAFTWYYRCGVVHGVMEAGQ